MCVVALALHGHVDWPLLLVANRDEYHARASSPLARWNDAPHILGGRDLVSGGGWLGVSEEGRLAVVTNIRSPEGPDPHKESRGALVSDWLIAGVVPPLHLFDSFNGFCLLTVSASQATLSANRPLAEQRSLAQGIHSLSNGMPDNPWPRRERLEAALADWLCGPATDLDALFALLRPAGDDAEEPIFINAPVYGTRCSTIVAINRAGQGRISERRFDEMGQLAGETTQRFVWRS